MQDTAGWQGRMLQMKMDDAKLVLLYNLTNPTYKNVINQTFD